MFFYNNIILFVLLKEKKKRINNANKCLKALDKKSKKNYLENRAFNISKLYL